MKTFFAILAYAVVAGIVVAYIGVSLGDSPEISQTRGIFVSIGAFCVGLIRAWKARRKNNVPGSNPTPSATKPPDDSAR